MKIKKAIISIIITSNILCLFLDSQVVLAKDKESRKNRTEQINILKDDLKEITSDEYKGRLTGTKENDLVSNLIMKRYRDIGLKPFDGSNYYHTYHQEIYYPDESSHFLEVIFKDGSRKEYVYGEDYIDYIRAVDLELNCDIFTKGEIEKDELKETRGDIAVVLDKEELTRELFSKNVKAIIKKYDEFVGVPFIADTRRANIQISDKCYKELIRKEAKKVSIKSKYKTEIKNVNNVIGKIEGVANKNGKALVISAHFDHVGWDGDTIFPGAVDNGSGTIGIMNIAEQLVKEKMNNDVFICAFNGEEYGLCGSKAFSEFIKDKYEEVVVINIDCIGKIDGKKLGIHGEKGNSDNLKKDIGEVLNRKDIQNYFDSVPNSDHSSFNYDNMYSVSLIQDNLFNPGRAIHTSNDQESLVDCEYIKNLCDAVVEYVLEYDNKFYSKK